MLYLDHAATTPVLPEALQAAWPFLTNEFGNPSSAHEMGHRAKNALDWARNACAAKIGCSPDEITFTSGGTESNNLAIKGLALANPRGKHIISAANEHSSVLDVLNFLERVHGFEITLLPVGADGSVTAAALEAAIRPDTTLVTLMLANNEIGTVHNLPSLSAVAKAHKVPFHTDAVQCAGWFDLNVREIGVDALSLSGHKFGSPKGSGLLYVRSRFDVEPVLHGGGQEHGFRSGTQNVAWAVALATVLNALPEPAQARSKAAAVTSAFIDAVLAKHPNAALTGPRPESGQRHPAIASFTFAGINGETLLLELENAGVVCSSGSACAAGSTEPSHVLLATGLDHDICRTAVRFSFGHEATTDEATQALAALDTALSRLG
jgi:cysteine desulfurase